MGGEGNILEGGVGGRKTEKNKETQEYPVAGNNESHFLCNRFQESSNMRERSQAEGFRAPEKMDSQILIGEQLI